MEHVVSPGRLIATSLDGKAGRQYLNARPALANQPRGKMKNGWSCMEISIRVICGIDREYTIFIMCRTEKRACALPQTRVKRDKTPDEVDEGASQD